MKGRVRGEKRAGIATPLPPHTRPSRLLSQATVALRTAAQLAKKHGGKLTVLHVVVPFYLPADFPLGNFVPEQRSHLEQLVTKTLGGDGPLVNVRVEVGDASQCIIDAAHRVDSIVMATSGRTGLAHFLIGSVAERVVRHATVPVLTIRVPIPTRPTKHRK
jgi:nucleotide-binding universal stress UspA family protein